MPKNDINRTKTGWCQSLAWAGLVGHLHTFRKKQEYQKNYNNITESSGRAFTRFGSQTYILQLVPSLSKKQNLEKIVHLILV